MERPIIDRWRGRRVSEDELSIGSSGQIYRQFRTNIQAVQDKLSILYTYIYFKEMLINID